MSSLRARCPDCKGHTAVALGPDYQCHACGREFAAGLVRVPRAWGVGGEGMAEAAFLAWGMPLRMILESGFVRVEHTALIGARSLDPPEQELIGRIGLCTAPERLGAVLVGTDAVYVALDVDVLDPAEIACFFPEPNGLTLDEIEVLLRRIAEHATVVGAGLTGLARDPANANRLTRLCSALGL